MSENKEYFLKICLVGSVDKLKTDLIRRFVPTPVDTNHLPTLDFDIITKNIMVDDLPVELVLMDTTGKSSFGKLSSSYYRNASACIIFFDKGDRKSFEDVPKWRQDFNKHIQLEAPFALVGSITKSEEVSTEEAQSFADQLNYTLFEYNPNDQKQLDKIFTSFTRQVIERSKD